MTREDQFIGQLEEYLDSYEGITPLPDGIRNAVRAELPRTKQAGPRTGLARFSGMSNAFKLGMAAAVIGVAALIGFTLYSNQIGPPDDAEPSPTAGEAQLPAELQDRWVGAARPTDGIPAVNGLILDTTEGELAIHIAQSRWITSEPSIDDVGRLRLETRTSIGGCQPDDVGTYTYSLTPGGSVLTLAVVEDSCAPRQSLLAGTWERAGCRSPDGDCLGGLEPGSYASLYFEPQDVVNWDVRYGALTYTVPSGWANYADSPDLYGLAPRDAYEAVPADECYDCPSTNPAVTLMSGPLAAVPDCQEQAVAGVRSTVSDLMSWLESHPGLVVRGRHGTNVGGHAATEFSLEVADDWTGTCDADPPFTAVPIFFKPDSFHWAMPKGERWDVTLVDISSDHTVAIVIDNDPDQLDAFVDDVQPIIDSFEFSEP